MLPVSSFLGSSFIGEVIVAAQIFCCLPFWVENTDPFASTLSPLRNWNKAGSFAKHYARRVQGKLSLQERVINGEHLCCFFDRIACCCTIYDNRPEQCRTFPFWERFKEDCRELLRECPGVSTL